MRNLNIPLLAAALVGMTSAGLADDRKADSPRKAPPGGFFLGDLFPLSAAGMMQESPKAAAPTTPPPPAPTSPWTVGGFAEFAYTYNFNRPENIPSHDLGAKENSFRIFDVDHNEFMVNHVQVAAAKTATDGSPIGFNVIAMVGQDAKWIHSAGLFDQGALGAVAGEGEDFDLIDAYVTLKVPERFIPLDTTISIGKWQTMHGAEVISGPANLNYSRSYLFGFAIPFTHTGVKADMKLIERGDTDNELLGIGAGIVNGWDNVKDNNDDKSFMAQVRLTPADVFKASVQMMFGPEQTSGPGVSVAGDYRNLIDITATVEPSKVIPALEGLSLSGNFDYGWEEAVPGLGYTEWYGFAGYVRYDFIRCAFLKNWHLGFRGEWFDDAKGYRTGADTEFLGLTTTLGYRPWEALLVRFEHRYDKADLEVFTDKGGSLDDQQNTLAVNMVVFY